MDSRLQVCCFLIAFMMLPARAMDNELKELQEDLGRGEWQLVKNDTVHRIKTYSKMEEGKRIRSFKVDAIIDASLDTIARVHFDYADYRRWYFKVDESRLLRQVSSTEVYYYQIFNAPFGLPNRDVVLRNVIEPYTPQKGYLQFNITAEPRYLPEYPQLVRMPAMNMVVKFTPLGARQTHLESEGYVDPGGMVSPAWATNYVQRQAPYQIMLGLQRVVLRDEYSKGREPLALRYRE